MLANLSENIENIVISMGAFAPLLACLLIVIESILPVLPLCVFITINFISFGSVLGFFISWICTCIGCFLSYYMVKKGLSEWTKRKAKKNEKLNMAIKWVKKLKLSTLTALIACPFTPAFAINIAAGLVDMDFRKYSIAIIIGKIVMVYFWGYIGLGLIESLKNPIVLFKVAIMVLLAYLASIILNKIVKDKI